MDMSYFNYCQGLTMTSKKFDQLFGGPPRSPETLLTQRDMDIAASIQVVTEEIMLRMARHVHAETGQKKLCLAGGVALNCVANGRILREGPFEDLWIQPAAGDAGGALGVALFIWHQLLENPRHAESLWMPSEARTSGRSSRDDEIRRFLGRRRRALPLLRKGRRAVRCGGRPDCQRKSRGLAGRDEWNSALAHWVLAAFWETPAASRCSRR